MTFDHSSEEMAMSVNTTSAVSHTSSVYSSHAGTKSAESSGGNSRSQSAATDLRGDSTSASQGEAQVTTQSKTTTVSNTTSSTSTTDLLNSIKYDKKDNNLDGTVTTLEENKYYLKHPSAKPQGGNAVGRYINVSA
jgi:hypothetical protein